MPDTIKLKYIGESFGVDALTNGKYTKQPLKMKGCIG